MSVKIVSLSLENVKRVRAVRMHPSENGLTLIGGDNAQGKTSILDGICYALGGEKYRPSNLQRDGSSAEARIELELSNGLKVERKGKNASLVVTDPTGTRQGQRLLDAFVETLALDLPKFLAMNGKDKASVLLRILGIGDQLAALDKEEKAAYDERHAQGRVADQKAKYAAEMPEHHDVPTEPLTPAELVRELQAIMARNAERANARKQIERLAFVAAQATREAAQKEARVMELREMLAVAERDCDAAAAAATKAVEDAEIAKRDQPSADESTAEVEAKLADLEAVNAKVRQNLDKRKAVEDAEAAAAECVRLAAKVENVRARRMALLNGAAMPLPGLSVENGELTYAGKAWDCMSSAEQMRSGVAIVRALKPECGFVLLDGLERFDTQQLAEFGAWLEAEGLQAIATRVSTGGECSIIIEDGLAVGQQEVEEPKQPAEESIDW